MSQTKQQKWVKATSKATQIEEKKLFNDAVVVVVQFVLLLLLWVKPPVFVELIEFVVSCLVLAIKRNVF